MPTVYANGIHIYYEEHKRQDRPLLVLIGGLTRDHTIWSSMLDTLSLHFRVLVFDNRGSGQTDKPAGPYSTAMLAEDTAALMEKIGFFPACVAGHSMGGFAAQYLAAKHPEKVAKLILCSTSIKPSEETIAYLKTRLELSQRGASVEEVIETVAPWVYAPHFLTKENMRMLIEGAKSSPFPQPGHALQAQIMACLHHNSSAILSSITAPTLVLTGKEDKLMPPKASEELASRIKGAKVALISEAGHALQNEKPEEFSRFITNF